MPSGLRLSPWWWQYVPEPESLHLGIRRLESGCYATLSPGGEVVGRRYFEPRFPVKPVTGGLESAEAKAIYRDIADALRDAVDPRSGGARRRHPRRPDAACLRGRLSPPLLDHL